MNQVVENLLCKCEILSSNSSPTNKTKRKKHKLLRKLLIIATSRQRGEGVWIRCEGRERNLLCFSFRLAYDLCSFFK
jgi:hypothetical protein